MTNHVLLDNINHKDLRIITGHAATLGDNVSYAVVFPNEFRHLQADYPLFFRKNDTSAQFEAIALLGFANGENLFLNKNTSQNDWDAQSIPLTIQRQPFLIGFQNTTDEGVVSRNPVVHIDMDHPRVSDSEGEAVFLEHGGNSPYLEHINSVLLGIYNGGEQSKTFADSLVELDLLEAFTLKIQLENGSTTELVGFYTINEDKLAALSGEALAQLHQLGFLQSIYMMMASTTNIPLMIEKKNQCLKTNA